MTVLECSDCGCKVESNRCCGAPMEAKDGKLICKSCEKEVEINHCCGNQMHEKIDSAKAQTEK